MYFGNCFSTLFVLRLYFLYSISLYEYMINPFEKFIFNLLQPRRYGYNKKNEKAIINLY